jgi:hypothetical protein
MLVLATPAAAVTYVPGYVEIEKPHENVTIRVPVAIEAGGTPPQGEYQEPGEPASGISITILFPSDGLETLVDNITAYGRAWSKDTITRVEYRLNGGKWQAASGTISWIAPPLQLVEGWNTIEVRAHDSKGRVATAKVKVRYIPEAASQGEWRVYRVPFPIKFFGWYSQAVFYTDTGFKVVIKAEGDGASYREHRRDPLTNRLHLYVYDPQGRLYADSYTIAVGQGKTVPGKLDFTYEVWDADYEPDSTLYYREVWQASRGLSTPRIYYSEDDGGWLHIKNLKVWLYEPKNLQRSFSITKSLQYCSYYDDDWGYFSSVYQVYSIGSVKKSCYFQHPVIQGKLVLYGDKETPHVVQQFYRATPFVYAKTIERDYNYDYCWSGKLIYGDKKTCPRDRYRTIYHQTFSSTEVTNNNVVLRVTDDSGSQRTTRLETYRRKKNEIDGWKSINDAFSAPSPAVTVYIRKQGGFWVTAGRYTFEYPYNVHMWDISTCCEYYNDRSIYVGTEYFYTSAKSLGLKPGWNTIEAKARDWTGRDSGIVTVGSIYYDPKPPWAVWIKPSQKIYFKENFEDGNLNGWNGAWRIAKGGYKSKYRAWSGQLYSNTPARYIYRSVSVPKDALISFMWSGSTARCDYDGDYGYGDQRIRFYIDGKQKAASPKCSFSWREAIVRISKGTHQIKWRYQGYFGHGSLDNIIIVEPLKTAVFEVSARLRDDWGIAKVEAMVEETAEIEANGKKASAGQWLIIVSYAKPRGKTDITVKFKVYSLGGQRERVHIRITDEAGNVREYVRDYYIDAPPFARLTFPKPDATVDPTYNTGDFIGEAFWSANKPVRTCYGPWCWGYSGSPVYVRVNGGTWYAASPTKVVRGSCGSWYCTNYYYWDTWKVSTNKPLLKPNAWNTVDVLVKDTAGRSATYTYKFYYKEPDTIVWNFDSGDYSQWKIAGYATGRSLPNAASASVGPGTAGATIASVKIGLSKPYFMTFWWKSTSTRTYGGWYYYSGRKTFYLDGSTVSVKGPSNWIKEGSSDPILLTKGTPHTLKWTISQDANGWVSRGYVDDIVLIADSKKPWADWISPKDGAEIWKTLDISAKVRDDKGLGKIQVMVEHSGAVQSASGASAGAGKWLTIASYSTLGKTSDTVTFKVVSYGGTEERVHIRIIDFAGNTREYVRRYVVKDHLRSIVWDFEDGTMSGWSFSGYKWTITTASHSGSYAATSTNRYRHSTSSCMYRTVDLVGPATLTFWWRVDSEAGYDYLRFYIDGTQKAAISGRVNWQQRTFTLTAGTHTLKWCYTKDGSVSRGADRGYVDDIVINWG